MPANLSSSSGKSRTPEAGSWRSALESLEINDDHWWCMVVMIVETLPDHSRLLSMINETAEEGPRKSIHALSYQKLMSALRTLSKGDPNKCPPLQGVCHQAAKVLSENVEGLPTWLLARVIKFLVYRVKVDDVTRSRRQMEIDHDLDRELQLMKTATTDPASAGVLEKQKNPTSDHSTKPKANTQLRRRGEEWRDQVFVDDAPPEGPRVFVILSGFHDPELPLQLVKAGVPLTCLLKIERPGEKVQPPSDVEVHRVVPVSNRRKMMIFRDQETRKDDLYRFWTGFEESLKSASVRQDLGGLMCRTFCPPEIPKSLDHEQYDRTRRDLYDRLSFLVYDLYDVHRQHIKYLRSMKLQEKLEEQSSIGMKRYTTIMDSIPSECVLIPLVLHALLAQVETDVPCFIPDHEKNREDFEEVLQKSPIRRSEVGTSLDDLLSGPGSRIADRIKQLNLKYGLSPEDQSDSSIEDPRLVLHGHYLDANTYHLHLEDDPREPSSKSSLSNGILNTMKNIWIFNLWEQFEELSEENLEKYAFHIDRLAHCFRTRINEAGVRHYINFLIFDKMVHGERLRQNLKEGEELEYKVSFPYVKMLKTGRERKVKSFSSLILEDEKSMSDDNGIKGFGSDTQIRYRESIRDTFECPSLVALMDPREMLKPGFLKEAGTIKRRESPPLREFDDGQLLSPEVFLQAVFDCMQDFQILKYEYLEPTDTILLCFKNEYDAEGMSRREVIAKIRTPVCLRDFCEYVLDEEVDWVRSEETTHDLEILQKLKETLKSEDEDEETGRKLKFTDEDFILPNSLKAQDGKKLKSEVARDQLKSRTPEVGPEKGKSKESALKVKTKVDSSRNKRFKDLLDTSFLPLREDLTPRCAKDEEPHEFVGYDLGNHRVQVVNRNDTFFSVDGTRVEVDLEEWLYEKPKLHLRVTLSGCTLYLHHTIGDLRSEDNPFHLMTKDGIVLAFNKVPRSKHRRSDPEDRWTELIYEFRASWPSGLVIEPIIGDGPENPFLIQQSYISKGPECRGILQECYRKFLRNGTVLSFLDDDTVTIYRPDGTIVRCKGFDAPHHSPKPEDPSDVSRERARNGRKSWRTSLTGKTRRRSQFKTGDSDHSEDDHDRSGLSEDIATEVRKKSFEYVSPVKITRYSVLESDGRYYEVFEDHLIGEEDELLVRQASDLEVDEKFIRRADGTDMLLTSKGDLAVSFPDGTRITTGFIVEKTPVICDWTDEEWEMYFENSPNFPSDDMSEDGGFLFCHPLKRGGDIRRKWLMKYESFVSIKMKSLMEHRNYASVGFDQSKIDCTLKMPGEVEVNFSRKALLDVLVTPKVKLKLRDDYLQFYMEVCKECGGTSDTVCKMSLEKENAVDLVHTSDVLGNVFKVHSDGTTSHRSVPGSCSMWDPEDGSEFQDPTCPKKCTPLGFPLRSRFRVFAMKRDLSAYEYMHRSDAISEEMAAVHGERSSVVYYPVPGRLGLRYLMTMVSMTPKTRSQFWLQDYKVPQVRPTNHTRTDILRSTYNVPYNWLFPFGRTGNGINPNTWDEPLSSCQDSGVPEVLIVRILQRIKGRDEDAVVALQTALGSYWSKFMNAFEGYRSYFPEGSLNHREERLKIWLRDVSLGRRRTLDQEIYLSGLSENRAPESNWSLVRISRISRHIQKRTLKKAEVEWYKECLREGTNIPYFENIAGSCFLWVKDCLEEALRLGNTKKEETRGQPRSLLEEVAVDSLEEPSRESLTSPSM
ncbi:uncharacterized protein LOC105700447 [Orussus abietinus]|uniref:uncharacterized protein LOC105700447 n=1 Tax=Orussus abietinus TaxID=222816 RepID=UPI000625D9C8|nr:uncharacterized protein LOC105700447 [Orussus abietinus]